MTEKAGQNSLDDLIASGGLPEATPTGEKTRDELIADKDAMVANLKDWRKGVELIASALGEKSPSDLSCARIAEAVLTLRAERDAEFVRGLERAQQKVSSVILGLEQMIHDAIAAEIDLEAFKRVQTVEDEIDKAK